MKKFFKSLIAICFALLLLSPMALAVGCSKNYTVNISFEGGTGTAYKKKTETVVNGKNTVKGKENFEFRIEPNDGYAIVKIEINGEVVKDDFTGDGRFSYYQTIENIKSNQNVKIYVEKAKYQVTFNCKENDLYVPYEPLSAEFVYQTVIDLAENKYGGAGNQIWYILDEHDAPVYIKELNQNRFVVGHSKSGYNLYCDLTREALTTLLSGLNEA